MDYQAKLALMMICVHCSKQHYIHEGVFNDSDEFFCSKCDVEEFMKIKCFHCHKQIIGDDLELFNRKSEMTADEFICFECQLLGLC